MKLLRYVLISMLSIIPIFGQSFVKDSIDSTKEISVKIDKQTPLDLYKYTQGSDMDSAWHTSHMSHMSHRSHSSHSSHYTSRF